MSEFLDLKNPMILALVFVQVIGFPIAFLVRAVVHAIKAKNDAVPGRAISLTKAAYNVCFALTSIGFCFSKPVGIVFFVIGAGFLMRQFVLTRQSDLSKVQIKTAPKPISIKSTRLRKRQA
jgi:hypothetical protein